MENSSRLVKKKEKKKNWHVHPLPFYVRWLKYMTPTPKMNISIIPWQADLKKKKSNLWYAFKELKKVWHTMLQTFPFSTHFPIKSKYTKFEHLLYFWRVWPVFFLGFKANFQSMSTSSHWKVASKRTCFQMSRWQLQRMRYLMTVFSRMWKWHTLWRWNFQYFLSYSTFYYTGKFKNYTIEHSLHKCYFNFRPKKNTNTVLRVVEWVALIRFLFGVCHY